MKLQAWAVIALLVGGALPAYAQQTGVKLQFDRGQVTLTAENAPVRTILAEWARLGGVTIVNGDRIAGAPVTLQLAGVPERQALDIVLRNVAGYMLAPRPVASNGMSAFDRIVILPTSVAPRNPAPTPSPAAINGPRPLLPRPPVTRPVDSSTEPTTLEPDSGSDANVDTPNPTLVNPTPPTIPQAVPQSSVPQGAPRAVAPGGRGGNVLVMAPEEPETTTNTGAAPTATNPFGIPAGSSATPGVVAPAPQQRPTPQQQQNTPGRVQ